MDWSTRPYLDLFPIPLRCGRSNLILSECARIIHESPAVPFDLVGNCCRTDGILRTQDSLDWVCPGRVAVPLALPHHTLYAIVLLLRAPGNHRPFRSATNDHPSLLSQFAVLQYVSAFPSTTQRQLSPFTPPTPSHTDD